MKQLMMDYTRPKYTLIYKAQRRFIRLACAVTIFSDATIALAFSTVAVKASLVHHGTPESLTEQYVAAAFVLNIVAALSYSLVADRLRKPLACAGQPRCSDALHLLLDPWLPASPFFHCPTALPGAHLLRVLGITHPQHPQRA